MLLVNRELSAVTIFVKLAQLGEMMGCGRLRGPSVAQAALRTEWGVRTLSADSLGPRLFGHESLSTESGQWAPVP